VTNLTGTASININGTVGATTPAAGTFTSLTDSGNLTFTGTGNRITGDFSNATVANRVAFQTSTVNGNTFIGVIPNGTATTTSLNLEGDSALTNGSVFSFGCGANSNTEARITSGIRGTGTYLPMTFYTGGSERMRVDTSGNVGIGTSSPTYLIETLANGSGSNLNLARFAATSAATGGSTAGINIVAASNLITIAGETSDAIAISTASTERMRIDSAGRVDMQSNMTPTGNGTASSISGTTLTVGGTVTGSFAVGDRIYGSGVEQNTFITALGTGTGGAGTYTVNNTQTVSSTSIAAIGGGVNVFRFTDTDTTASSGQAMGRIEWYGSDESTPGAGVKAYISGINESSTPDAALIFGTSDNVANTQAVERLRIDSSGNVGIGTTSPDANLTINGAASFAAGSAAAPSITRAGDLNTGIFFPAADTIAFTEGGVESARITSNGDLLVATTTEDSPGLGNNTVAIALNSNGQFFASSAGTPGFFNRTADGTIVSFQSAGTAEGTISISGSTTSYNGGHLSRWAQMLTKPDLLKGTVMSNLDDMNVYIDADGNTVENEQLNKVKVSDVEGDANVAGVFVNWTHDDAHNVDEINMAMTGDMIIRIAQGVTVQRGDLLMSAGDGTAKPQGDDIIRSKTVAKVTSTHVTCTYEDGSYCVPCVLMAC
jgi:hypothetical protein